MNYELSKEEIRDMLCENKVWDAIEELKDGFIEEHEGDNEARRRLGQEEEELVGMICKERLQTLEENHPLFGIKKVLTPYSILTL